MPVDKLRLILWWLILLLLIADLVAIGFYGRNVDVERHLNFLESIRNLAAIVLGVMGAWLAIVFRGGLSAVLGAGQIDNAEIDNLRRLLWCLRISICIVGFSLVHQVTLMALDSESRVNLIVSSISFALISFYCLLQFVSLVLVFLPAEAVELLVMRKASAMEQADLRRRKGRRQSKRITTGSEKGAH